MLPFSSRGPREDGGFKPNVTAPGAAISTIPTWLPGGPVAEAGYTLPPGYSMLQGHLDGVPAGRRRRGAAAVGRQGHGHQRVTPRQLRDSLYTSADYVKDVEAIGAGRGPGRHPRTPGSLLKTEPDRPGHTPSRPRSAHRARTSWPRPGLGTGVYNRCDAAQGGQVAGREQDVQRQGHPHQRAGRRRRARAAPRGQRRHLPVADRRVVRCR